MTENIINIAVVVAGIDEEYQNNIICGINKYTRESKINTSYFATFGGVLSNQCQQLKRNWHLPRKKIK